MIQSFFLISENRLLDFWCSTKTDVNGFHITGPFEDPGVRVLKFRNCNNKKQWCAQIIAWEVGSLKGCKKGVDMPLPIIYLKEGGGWGVKVLFLHELVEIIEIYLLLSFYNLLGY